MDTRKNRSWIGQILLFLLLSLLFSALPFLLALILDKSSKYLAVFMAWYAALPPLLLFILAWLLYRGQKPWIRFIARLWISIGLWFGLQALLAALSDVHLLVMLFTLPAMLAGSQGYLLGTAVFLLGGLILWFLPIRLKSIETAGRSGKVFAISTVGLLLIILVAFPLFTSLTSLVGNSIPEVGPPLPDEEEVFGYVSEVYDMGIRRPGWEAAAQTKDYLSDRLNEFGFSEVNVEPHQFDLWRENSWSLTVDPAGLAWQPETYFVPYSGPTAPQGIEAVIVYLGEGTEQDFDSTDVAGKIVLVDLPPMNISWTQMKLFTYMAYDRGDTVGDWEHPYPIGWLTDVHRVHDLAEESGAVGFIGVLQGYPQMGEFGYYAPYDGTLRPIPGLYLLDEDGDQLREMVKAGPLPANLTLDADVSLGGGTAWTVYGILPGTEKRIVMVHTHYDAPWRSGIEDSSGVGMVLGLARYYAALPQSERKYTMVFIFMGSHMVGAPSNHAFMEQHASDIMDEMLVDVCIEHIADDYNPPNPPTGMAEPRGNFMVENPILVSLYAGAVVEHGAIRTLVFPTGTPLGVPTDAGMFARSGYPVSSLISGPVWLFDDDDTLERVATWEFASLSAMYIDYIQRLGRVNAALLRFNLNFWTVILTAILLTPLAALSAAHWPRRS